MMSETKSPALEVAQELFDFCVGSVMKGVLSAKSVGVDDVEMDPDNELTDEEREEARDVAIEIAACMCAGEAWRAPVETFETEEMACTVAGGHVLADALSMALGHKQHSEQHEMLTDALVFIMHGVNVAVRKSHGLEPLDAEAFEGMLTARMLLAGHQHEMRKKEAEDEEAAEAAVGAPGAAAEGA